MTSKINSPHKTSSKLSGNTQTKTAVSRKPAPPKSPQQVPSWANTAVPPIQLSHKTKPPSNTIQREEKEKDKSSSEAFSGGAALTYKYLQKNPGFSAWQKEQTDRLKLKLWDSQPTEFKAGMIGFGLLNLGLLGSMIATDPTLRADTVDFLQGKNLLTPAKLIPYSEYFPISSFNFKLPSAESSPYTFETEFSFDAWFKLMQEKWGMPPIGLGAGVKSAYSSDAGFSPITGGSLKLKFGGGFINLSGFLNQKLPQSPMLLPAQNPGDPPVWLMRSIPAQPGMEAPLGSGVFLTLDFMRIPELVNPPAKKGK